MQLCTLQQTDMSQAEPTWLAADHVRNSRTQVHYLTDSIRSHLQPLLTAALPPVNIALTKAMSRRGMTYRMSAELEIVNLVESAES